jgi:class 3 adenylate cyclase
MKCPRCQAQNAADSSFCEECGARLALGCPSCGAPVVEGKKFCRACGAALSPSSVSERFASLQDYTPKHLAERILSSRSALEGERKQVTVLFADLKGSMELLADRDPEEARKLLDPVLERMIEAVHRYDGTVNQVMGDGVMALFGAPLALEDHAARACYAALRMQDTLARHAEELRRLGAVPIQIRVGLNSGEVVVRAIDSDLHMDYSAVGQTTHLAARMEQIATAGSVLLTASTLKLAEGYVQVKPLGAVPVKGLPDPVDVYELTGTGSARTRIQVSAIRGLSRFVGRDSELDQLRRALEKSGAGQGQVVSVVGEPGVGKSRLFYELVHSHRTQGWLVLEAASVSYGKATSYLPAVELMKTYFRIQDSDTQRDIREKITGKLLTLDETLRPALPALASLLDLPVEDIEWRELAPDVRRKRTLDSLKRLLLREAQVQPLLLIFEDLHWTDSETHALLDAMVESLPAAKLLLLTNYRPEYQQRWGARTYYTQVSLDALPPESAVELLESLLGQDRALEPLKQLLVASTEGNPFFLEECVRALVETRALVGDGGASRLTQPVSACACPRLFKRSSRPVSTVSSRRRSTCCRWPPSSARTFRSACCAKSPIAPKRSLPSGCMSCSPGNTCTKASSFPTWSTPSSTP